MSLLEEAFTVLRRHSTNYVEPILVMPPVLQETKLAAYLIMRGIDEIEDHPDLDGDSKTALLDGVSQAIQGRLTEKAIDSLCSTHGPAIPEVTLRIADWARLLPDEIGPRVLDAFATMGERMADWVRADFRIESEHDLDRYTYSVAGSLALMLGDVWTWFDGTRCNRTWLVGYGRGIQAANIMQDKETDAQRGVSFVPPGWDHRRMHDYARRELLLADRHVDALAPASPARRWCEQPMAIAWHTVNTAVAGTVRADG
ncbi:squalene/phytoene synthase family protein [Amycolatopsis sp. GM8]|uniref:squalene/phytoene synthase family protein n=1 Tax=Amycolatopsis sp. GM8 TaxID=2896530 RepID=UPI001F193A17|nr:squalene/phytoene synthase family protein [Amycolatopsis sp. GM8]